ncbi:MAG: hypothetical protein ABI655_08600, partial [Phenylobacterium sp.]
MRTLKTTTCGVALGLALAVAGAASAQAYNQGDHVEVYSSMTGRWEKATVMRQDGTMADGRARYFIHAEDPNIVNAYFGVASDGIRPAEPAAAGGPGGMQSAGPGLMPMAGPG